MPKDKEQKIRFITEPLAKEYCAGARRQDLATDLGYPLKESSEEKAEPQSESEIMCYYYTGEEPHHCPGPMGDERSYVIKNSKMVMAHRRCHKRDQDGEKKSAKVMIR